MELFRFTISPQVAERQRSPFAGYAAYQRRNPDAAFCISGWRQWCGFDIRNRRQRIL
jgi:hypothetical protein